MQKTENSIPCKECITRPACKEKHTVYCCILFKYVIENEGVTNYKPGDTKGHMDQVMVDKLRKFLPYFSTIYDERGKR